MIVVPSRLLDQISDEAVRAYPEECCGLLVGRVHGDGSVRVTRVVASNNVALADRRRRFEVDPELRFRLMRDLRGGAEDIVGHYHSHPDHPALPSASDTDNAWEPDLIWLITAVPSGQAGETRAYAVDPAAGGFREIQLSASPEGGC